MTEEELKIALEQNGSASAVLLKEAFDILNAKISGISAQDPRIAGAVSAVSPATLGTNVSIGSTVKIYDNVAIGKGVNILEGVELYYSVSMEEYEEGIKRVAFVDSFGNNTYVPSCYDVVNMVPMPVSFVVNGAEKQLGVEVNGAHLGTISIDIV